jgi:hypothetical protein
VHTSVANTGDWDFAYIPPKFSELQNGFFICFFFCPLIEFSSFKDD